MRTPPGRLGRLRDRARVRRDGKRDGQLGIPTTNEVTHPPALMAIAQRADEAVADLVRSWAGEDARLRERSGANTYGLRTSEEDIRAASVDVTDAQQRRRVLDAQHDADLTRITDTRRRADLDPRLRGRDRRDPARRVPVERDRVPTVR